ncbi:DNA ligase, NAD-dependent [Cyanobium sp. PCC 7001]|nr:DNA ligase, NAD-dependent [Cyanobium sp. PCC 7001]
MAGAPEPLRDRIAELQRLLTQAAHAYYVLDAPVMEDPVYDRLYRELLELEQAHPELIRPDSPTQRVGGSPAEGFRSVEHRIALLSLDNAFSTEELEAWYARLLKVLDRTPAAGEPLPDLAMVGELKIDGNALALSYREGLLERAATRGDGERGEEITANVRTIQSVPLRLRLQAPPAWVEVRGEALIPDGTFAAINAERLARGEPAFANPRNACAGTLRQLDPQVVADRRLDFFAYTLHLPDDWQPGPGDPPRPSSQWESLAWLRAAGFKVNPNAELLADLAAVEAFFTRWEPERRQLPYATDGVVVKLDDLRLQADAGFTQKAPRWAIALKYAAEEAPSRLLRLSCQVGRTGVVTPVAEFEPVALAGTSVSRATLHNADRLAELDLHAGDTIVVRKAGEIIPEVVRVLPELRPAAARRLELPRHCPECGSELVREAGEAATRCVNSSCPAILRGALRHWVSKAALDVDGLGSKLIEQLVDRGLVRSIAGLYRLDAALLASLERMGGEVGGQSGGGPGRLETAALAPPALRPRHPPRGRGECQGPRQGFSERRRSGGGRRRRVRADHGGVRHRRRDRPEPAAVVPHPRQPGAAGGAGGAGLQPGGQSRGGRRWSGGGGRRRSLGGPHLRAHRHPAQPQPPPGPGADRGRRRQGHGLGEQEDQLRGGR